MKSKYSILSILVVVALSSCTQAKHFFSNKINPDNSNISQKEFNRWDKILGKWYSKSKVSNNSIQECLVERFSDGKYIVEFKITEENGSISKHTETGDWGLVKKFHFTTYRTISDENNTDDFPANSPQSFDIYKITKFKNNKFYFRTIRTRNKFKSVKVDKDFRLN